VPPTAIAGAGLPRLVMMPPDQLIGIEPVRASPSREKLAINAVMAAACRSISRRGHGWMAMMQETS